MRSHSPASALALLSALGFLFCVTFVVARSSSGSPLVRSKLYQTSRARLALARAKGQTTFPVMIASGTGKNASVVSAISAAGGRVEYRADDVDYLRGTLPIARVEDIARNPNVTAISADESVTVLYRPKSSSTVDGVRPSKKEDLDGPITHPYRPGDDIGTLRLRTKHPTFDGRGTTIAVMDGTPDFLDPEFRYARSVDGKLIDKFADIRTSVEPNEVSDDTPWLATVPVHVEADTFTNHGAVYHAPHDGTFQFALVPKNGHYAAIYAAINGGGSYYEEASQWNKAAAKRKDLFAVLWDLKSNLVWIDTKRDGNFGEASPITDYAVAHQYDVVPVVTKEKNVRPTAGVVIQTDPVDRKLALLFGTAWHASGANGSAAASHEGGGRIDGIAPGAQLLSLYPSGVRLHGIIEGVMWAMRDPKVDVVCPEFISPLSYAPKDGQEVEAIVFNRLAARYDKPLMQPGGNDPGMGQINGAGLRDLVFSIEEYQSAASYRINKGLDVPTRDNSAFGGSFGPPGDGGIKPTFMTPSGWIVPQPGFAKSDGNMLKGVYNLPAGYMIFGGTSQATPTASGGLAVLLSGARQMHIHFSVAQLMDATIRTARYMRLPAYVQGAGLLQVDRAWDALIRARVHPFTQVTFDAPVRTATSWMLQAPNRGKGLFEREGWTAGMRGSRTVWVTRRNGPASMQMYATEIQGNDGTFSAPPSLMLGLQRQRALPISISVRTPGAHSALLVLRDPNSNQVAGETMVTVVAGRELVAANAYAATQLLRVHRPGGSTSMFVTVPPGTQALMVRFNSPRAGIQFIPFNPDSSDPLNYSNNLLSSVVLERGTGQFVFAHPQPGTWELQFTDETDANKHVDSESHPARPTPVRVTATAVNVGVTQRPSVLMSRSLAGSAPALAVTRAVAETTVHADSIGPGGQRSYTIQVPQGATGVGAFLKTNAGTSIDLYLFQCPQKSCLIRQKSVNVSEQQYVYQDRPKAGRWKVVVDGYLAAAAGTRYDLRTFAIEGVPAARPRGVTLEPVAAVGALAQDPRYYYNEDGPEEGWHNPRPGLNPVVFDVQELSSAK